MAAICQTSNPCFIHVPNASICCNLPFSKRKQAIASRNPSSRKYPRRPFRLLIQSSVCGSISGVNSEHDAELQRLLALIPSELKKNITSHPEFENLIEIVMDLGRKPFARFPSGDFILSNKPVTRRDMDQAISMVGNFADDNRAGIDRSLHRISAIRNRRGRIIGLTCRVGRAVSGSADMVRDLVESGGSLLIIGSPGVGKTTVIRDIARMLADEHKKRVIVVDTSNEIAGDGDIPHRGIGSARRMQVPNVDLQHKIMIEAVENHMPQAIVIDEIGTELEALAASTISQRGIQLVGTAHGMTIENLIKNPSLDILVGGVQTVTLGDEEAFRRRVQKTVLERRGPPVFTSAVEMISQIEWRIHHSLAATVDALLTGRSPLFEIRKMGSYPDPNGTSHTNRKINFQSHDFKTEEQYNYDLDTIKYGMDGDNYGSSLNRFNEHQRNNMLPVNLYLYEIMKDDMMQILEAMGLENDVQFTYDIGEADAILALHSKIKQNMWLREMAKFHQLPVFVTKTNTRSQLVRAARAILGMENFNMVPSRSYLSTKKDNQSDEKAIERKNSLHQTDALEEARVAIEHIVIPKGQPVELLPRPSELLSQQMKLAEGYNLTVEKVGSQSNERLRVLPLSANVEEDAPSDLDAAEEGERLEEINISESTSGITFERLPFLPE